MVVEAHTEKSTQDRPGLQGIWVSFLEVELASCLKVPIPGARRALGSVLMGSDVDSAVEAIGRSYGLLCGKNELTTMNTVTAMGLLVLLFAYTIESTIQ